MLLSCNSGLSPRGRGNPVDADGRLVLLGSIPAWAGKPSAKLSRMVSIEVYPRVGGETAGKPNAGIKIKGLSPRGRGNRNIVQFGPYNRRSIPAWAGKPAPQGWGR